MKSVSRAGVKLWAPPSIVKFGCLVHDVQLSSRARRICLMVSESSIQIVIFASPVSLRMVLLVCQVVAGNGQGLCTHEDALTQVAHCGPCRFGQSEILFSTACHGQFRTDPYAYSPYHVGN